MNTEKGVCISRDENFGFYIAVGILILAFFAWINKDISTGVFVFIVGISALLAINTRTGSLFLKKEDGQLVLCDRTGEIKKAVDLNKEVFWQELVAISVGGTNRAKFYGEVVHTWEEKRKYWGYLLITNELFQPYPDYQWRYDGKSTPDHYDIDELMGSVMNSDRQYILVPKLELSQEDINEITSWTEIHTVDPSRIPSDAYRLVEYGKKPPRPRPIDSFN